MVLHVRPTPTRFPTNNIPNTSVRQDIFTKCVTPVGSVDVIVVETWRLGSLENGFPSKR